jgi:tetratricopeptide (TPR) repeat protein
LDEIERSRPFLIVLLGDRYGWVPPQERMAAAAEEAGFAGDLQDKSVTALEIEFGILRQDPQQRRRSFFYSREPLPYEQMPKHLQADYNDEYSDDADTRRRHGRLTELKRLLADDPELAPRVYSYHANWDAVQQKVVGLEAWGEQVYQHLLRELEPELRAAATRPPQTWQEQERIELAEFIEHRCRDFVGRKELLDKLASIAVSPTSAEAGCAISAGVPWGACLLGEPGSGKSAIFAVLATRLSADDSVLLLTNAAGATTRGSQIDAMLRRFIGELADALGIADPLPEKATADDVEATFASLLGQVAETRRVVMLLDGLNEFGATTRAERLAWLRAQQWPANARLIATSLACSAADALSQWPGIERLSVPPLNTTEDEQTDDVTLIARAMYQRYHRQVNPRVVRVLRQKRLPDDSFAAGNPLWLTLALEQINLLDADDFARADREFAARGSAAERQQAMLLDTAERMPPTVVGMYDWLLTQGEKVFGLPVARAFAALIAVSRFGWRESDLLKLIPAAAGVLGPGQPEPKLDDLQLAALRRSFRAHLVRRGNLKQLDFFHRQMRQAVRERALTDKPTTLALHRVIADHLESLESDDQLRNGELMVHLIAGDDPLRAAKTYATIPQSWQRLMSGMSSQTWSELPTTSDTITLANFISAGSGAESKRHCEWVTSLLDQPGLTGEQISNLIVRIENDLGKLLVQTTDLKTRQLFSTASLAALRRLIARDPKPGWQYQISFSLQNLGDLAMARGDLPEAKRYHSEARDIQQRFLGAIPPSAGPAAQSFKKIYSVSLEKLGNVAMAEGNYSEAQQLFEEAHQLHLGLVKSNPSNPEILNGHVISLQKLGNVAMKVGDISKAERYYLEMHGVADQLVKAFPATAMWKETLALASHKLGNVYLTKGELQHARKHYSDAYQVYDRLCQSERANAQVQRDRAAAQANLARIAESHGQLSEARRLCDDCHRTFQRLAESDPDNTERQRDLISSFEQLGNLARLQGNMTEAQQFADEARRIRQHLTKSAPPNTERHD